MLQRTPLLISLRMTKILTIPVPQETTTGRLSGELGPKLIYEGEEVYETFLDRLGLHSLSFYDYTENCGDWCKR